MVLEPKLYAGDVLAFNQFLKVLAQTGPVPSGLLRANAYARLTNWIETGDPARGITKRRS
jgi:hypothetical protein